MSGEESFCVLADISEVVSYDQDLLDWQKNRTGHPILAVKLSVTRIILLSLNSSYREVHAKVKQQDKTNTSANEPVNIKHLFFRVVLQHFNRLCF